MRQHTMARDNRSYRTILTEVDFLKL